MKNREKQIIFGSLTFVFFYTFYVVRSLTPNEEEIPQLFGTKHPLTVLTDSNFHSTISGSWIVEFYNPWCGHCKQFAPTFLQTQKHYSIPYHVKFAIVDVTSEHEVTELYMIMGTPSIIFFRDGFEVGRIRGMPTTADLKNFIVKPEGYVWEGEEEEEDWEEEEGEEYEDGGEEEVGEEEEVEEEQEGGEGDVKDNDENIEERSDESLLRNIKSKYQNEEPETDQVNENQEDEYEEQEEDNNNNNNNNDEFEGENEEEENDNGDDIENENVDLEEKAIESQETIGNEENS